MGLTILYAVRVCQDLSWSWAGRDAWKSFNDALKTNAGQGIVGLPDPASLEEAFGQQQVVKQWFLSFIKSSSPQDLTIAGTDQVCLICNRGGVVNRQRSSLAIVIACDDAGEHGIQRTLAWIWRPRLGGCMPYARRRLFSARRPNPTKPVAHKLSQTPGAFLFRGGLCRPREG